VLPAAAPLRYLCTANTWLLAQRMWSDGSEASGVSGEKPSLVAVDFSLLRLGWSRCKNHCSKRRHDPTTNQAKFTSLGLNCMSLQLAVVWSAPTSSGKQFCNFCAKWDVDTSQQYFNVLKT